MELTSAWPLIKIANEPLWMDIPDDTMANCDPGVGLKIVQGKVGPVDFAGIVADLDFAAHARVTRTVVVDLVTSWHVVRVEDDDKREKLSL